MTASTRLRYDANVLVCGVLFKKMRSYVCVDCGVHGEHAPSRGRIPARCPSCAASRIAKRHSQYTTAYVCKRCGIGFRAQSYRAHCSKECNAAYIESLKRKATCKKCGTVFRPKNPRHWQYCSRECSYADISTWYVAPTAEYRSIRYSKVDFKPCQVCGKTFTEVERGAQTCLGCRGKLGAHNVARRSLRKHHIRRAKNAGVAYENLDPLVVFERANWVCQICGGRTPPEKRGTYDDDAPELDHIIPMSIGGPHMLFNVQCTCKKCNREKSDTL